MSYAVNSAACAAADIDDAPGAGENAAPRFANHCIAIDNSPGWSMCSLEKDSAVAMLTNEICTVSNLLGSQMALVRSCELCSAKNAGIESALAPDNGMY